MCILLSIVYWRRQFLAGIPQQREPITAFPLRPEQNHRDNIVLFLNSDVDSFNVPYQTMTEKMQERGPTVYRP